MRGSSGHSDATHDRFLSYLHYYVLYVPRGFLYMSGLFTCLCTLAMVWVAMSVIGGIFGRRRGGFGGGFGGGLGNGFGGGFGGLLGGLGLGWMMGNMMNGNQHNHDNQSGNVIDGETWGNEQIDHDTQIEDNGGGWDSGEWSGGDDSGGSDSGGWSDA